MATRLREVDSMKADRHYIRVYDDDLRRDYPEIWTDDRALATWTRLLSIADKMWPTLPELPRSAKGVPLAALVRCGLVEPHPDHTYTIRGLHVERTKRAAQAQGAANARWGTVSNADSNTPSIPQEMPRRNETKTSKDDTNARDRDDDGRADLEAFLLVCRRAPTPKQRTLLDEVMARHDQTGPAWAADLMLRNPTDPIGAVIEADKAWRAERIAQAQAAERPIPKPKRRGSGLTGINAELSSYFRGLEQGRKVDPDAA